MAENLTSKQYKAIEVLLTTGNITKAAEAAGVTAKTVHVWLKSEPFRAEVQAGEALALESLSRSLVALGEDATQALHDAMSKTNPPGARVRAADIVLSRLLQLRELVELEQRIAALEKQAQR